jgi:hypothetical protein
VDFVFSSSFLIVVHREKYLSLSRDGVGLPKLEALALRKMVFSKKYPSFEFFTASCHGELLTSKDKDNKAAAALIKETKLKDGGLEIELLNDPATGLPVWTFLKDFQFEFFKGKLFGGKERVMSFWLHTQFLALEPNYYLKMERMDIDKVSKTKGMADFTLELFFEPISVGKKAAEASNAAALLASNPQLPPSLADTLRGPHAPPADQAEMIATALAMMLEGRKMTRFYLGDPTKVPREKEVEKREVFLQIRDEAASANGAGASSPSPAAPKKWALVWSVDLLGSGPAAVGAASSTSGNANTQAAVAAAAAQGEQKLLLSDIGSLLIGKQDPIWVRSVPSRSAVEDRCLSILSREQRAGAAAPKVQLHLEAYSERQLSLWVEGIKWLLEHGVAEAPALKEEEGELFPQSIASALMAGPPSHNRGSSVANTPSSPAAAAAKQAQVEKEKADAEKAAAASVASSASSAASGDAADDDLEGGPDDGFDMVMVGRQGRAESFARPPPIRVPQNRRRRVISVLDKNPAIAEE